MAKPKEEKQMIRHMFSKRQSHKDTSPTREDIERLAYHIYLSKGGQDGHAVDDWLQAERELEKRGG